MCISAIGLYNILHWNPHVYEALSPYYMYKFLKKTQGRGWMSLGGILLCMTGTTPHDLQSDFSFKVICLNAIIRSGSEAMYADLGHFSQLSIKVKFKLFQYQILHIRIMFEREVKLQIAFTFVVYPALVLAYMGQAAYLSTHHIIEKDYQIGFYVSVPGT